MILQRGDDDFDWSLETDLPAPPQLATTVYDNAKGEVVIRQRDDGFEDGDTIIILTSRNAHNIGRALIALAKDMGVSPDRVFGDGQEGPFDDPPANDTAKPEALPPLLAVMAAEPRAQAAE